MTSDKGLYSGVNSFITCTTKDCIQNLVVQGKTANLAAVSWRCLRT